MFKFKNEAVKKSQITFRPDVSISEDTSKILDEYMWSGSIPIYSIFPPLSVEAYIDVGLYKLSGLGSHDISFGTSFANTPTLVQTVFGYWDILGIKVPMPGFIINVSNSGFKVFTLGGDYYVSYIAIGQ